MDLANLTIEDLRVIRDSLDYSLRRVSNYQHLDHLHKRESLRPIEAASAKVRAIIASGKEAKDGPHP